MTARRRRFRWAWFALLPGLLAAGVLSATPAGAQDDDAGQGSLTYDETREAVVAWCEANGGSSGDGVPADERDDLDVDLETHVICVLVAGGADRCYALDHSELPTGAGEVDVERDPGSRTCVVAVEVGVDPERPDIAADLPELEDFDAEIIGIPGQYEVEFTCERAATWWGHAVWESFTSFGPGTTTSHTHRIPLQVHEEHPWFVEEAIENNCSPPELPVSRCWHGEDDSEWIGLSEDHDHDTYRHFLPDDCWGTYPTRNFDVHFDHGGNFGFSNKVWGWLTELVYQIGKGALALSFWLTGVAQAFDITESYDGALFGDEDSDGAIAQIDVEIVEGLRLTRLAWLALFGYVGVMVARGRLTLGGGQLAITVVALGLATVLLANPQGYMQGASDTTSGLSTQVLAAAATGTAREQCDSIDAATEQTPRLKDCAGYVHRDLLKQLHVLFVEVPYDYINWGERIDEDHPCRAQRDRILSVGPHGTDAWPRLHMGQRDDNPNRCEQLMLFNEDADSGRFLTALATTVAGLTLAVFLGLTALTVLIGQLVTAILFAVAPVAAVAAILPGGGRRLAWLWTNTIIQAIVVVVAMSFLLAVGMLMIVPTLATAMGDGEDSRSPIMAYLLVLGPLLAMGMARRKLLAGVKSTTDSFSDRLTRLAPGASSPGFAQVGPLGGGGGGFGGGGLGDRSIFEAARPGSVSGGLTVANTGAAAAIGAAGLAGRAVSTPLGAARGAVGGRRSQGRAANRTQSNNANLKVFDRAIAKREAGGKPTMTNADVAAMMLKPRHQRKYHRARRANAVVDRYRRSGQRRFYDPIAEKGLSGLVKASYAFREHNAFTPKGWANRNDRERWKDPQVSLGRGRAGRSAYKEFRDTLAARDDDGSR